MTFEWIFELNDDIISIIFFDEFILNFEFKIIKVFFVFLEVWFDFWIINFLIFDEIMIEIRLK